ncbi:MAG: RHS repeat domain-containing protein [Candidatus Neomarinimicrobiota bacterium]
MNSITQMNNQSPCESPSLQKGGASRSERGGFVFGARYYDPELGRFTQTDPLGQDYPGWSPYVYALDNPLIYVDPNGKIVIKESLMRKYPILALAIYSAEQLALYDPRVRATFHTRIGVPVSEFVGFGLLSDTGEPIGEPGRGPEVILPEIPIHEWAAGRYQGNEPPPVGPEQKNKIQVAAWLVVKLESGPAEEKAAAFELLKRTILHETAHQQLKNADYDIDTWFNLEAFGEPDRFEEKQESFWDWWWDLWQKGEVDPTGPESNQ